MAVTVTVKFRITFQPAWVLARRDARMLPVDRTAQQIKSVFDGKITRSNLTECEGTIEMPDAAAAEYSLNALVAKEFGIDAKDSCFSVTVEELPEEPQQPADEEQPKPEAPKPEAPAEEKKSEPGLTFALPPLPKTGAQQPQQPEQSKKKDAPEQKKSTTELLDEIDGLIGAEEFKQVCAEAVAVAPLLKQSDTLETFTRRCYLFSVNAGCGLSVYLDLYVKLIESLGLFSFGTQSALPASLSGGKRSHVIEASLPAPESDQNVVNAMNNIMQQSKNNLVCIDISPWMNKIDVPEFREVLRNAEQHAGECIICFRVPFVEHSVLRRLHKALNDQLFVRDVTIVPFDTAELERYGKKLLDDKSFTVAEDAWEIFQARISEERNDGRFYGFHTVRKVVMEMLYMKQLADALNGNSDRIVKRDEIQTLCSNETGIEKTGEEMLNEMVGMEAIRDQVYTIVGQITAAMADNTLEAPCIHMRFLGSPGTGKTTVARIIGKLLCEKGVLRVGAFIERHSRDLCGEYIGQTAPRTAAACRDAYGSVLFIDEAYALYRGGDTSKRDYGIEAIDTLIAEMENHRTDMVVIMAGYSDDMEALMGANAGLRSRMPFAITFPNYTKEQLAEIYMRMAAKSFTCGPEFEQAVRDFFNSMDQKVIDAKEFSNARFVRNLFERTWGKAVLRCQMAGTPCKELRPEDLTLALSDPEFQNIIGHQARTLGFA